MLPVIPSIILASQSPRRKQLLEWAEVNFTVEVISTDESYPPTLSVEEVPVFIAREKARQVNASKNPNGLPLLAADTVVVLNDRIIGKPQHHQEAIEILTALSGQTHRVITGVVILHQKGEIAFADITEVTFHAISSEQIEHYVTNYQPFDKAGAYAIQEWIGVVGIQSVKGDFYNVMGLPVSRVIQHLYSISGY
ncbi:MAG: septum formation protein Maf [Chitinophagia bacterium]|nr:septum formation protein Maf [Chitinophagia bacterium]